MRKKIVYEYFLNEDGLIKGWQIWPAEKRADLVRNQPPLQGMIGAGLDSGRAILSGAGKNFRLAADGSVAEVDHVYTDQEIVGRMSPDEKMRIVMKGIENPQDAEFIDFKNKLNALPG